MNLLIVGANGFIGAPLARAAVAAGIEVTAIARHLPTMEVEGVEYVHLDRRDAEGVIATVHRRRIDTVVDVIAYIKRRTLPLLDALEHEIERYVLLSSADVYANYELLHRRREGLPTAVLDESAPLRNTRFPYRLDQPRARNAPDAWMDEYDKIPIEEAVRRMACAWTILRLPMVFGPGDQQRRFRWAIEHMLTQTEPLRLPAVWADWVTSFGFVDNVAAAILHAAGHAQAARAVINVGERESVAQQVWAARFGERLAWTHGIERGPEPGFEARIAALDLSVPLALDSGELHDTLGFTAPISLADALDATIADERTHLAPAPG